jgi:hypothetical protein
VNKYDDVRLGNVDGSITSVDEVVLDRTNAGDHATGSPPSILHVHLYVKSGGDDGNGVDNGNTETLDVKIKFLNGFIFNLLSFIDCT